MTATDWSGIMEDFMKMFMEFFTKAILPIMMMMLFIRMMVGMISSIGRSFAGPGAGFI